MGQQLIFLKRANKILNRTFVSIILVIFYILIIGIARVIYTISQNKSARQTTYWQESKKRINLASAY
ncbi:MAG: hypothetical protein A3C30_02955 [Candidatus Levybacteria bacterium RIFCSPHIGHO2_02_FULL_40_18]|nr:MAG: hypothetical protein A2869_05025 [Candidatus Levybacteria bacterium RIFCSPHIGHO2_01_FULL_40_58]OGH26934.1 MAG: hypothetical protein A3C30_02955 [Candidatus Levybacteria bacterium RIFCSPHIGHO2_02_FULL_40_18]OGH32056.1 MAG: hypothetical protein A3E43_03935 [Candidatus Levybacteria bacterium RIFCSPHIGHO2_12_FULL_40_31]OGH40822.1 MAG: hypothetical protein A2894_04465 [Candidatus Levybacteria bacterium RIFCSPLOWO2_01_FULL_40_64]OGH48678.1 MAG: hypothetical protein A3I54_03395 [Candidatus Lev